MVLTMPESSEKILDELRCLLQDEEPCTIITVGLGFLRLTVSYTDKASCCPSGLSLPSSLPPAAFLPRLETWGRAEAELRLWLRLGRGMASARLSRLQGQRGKVPVATHVWCHFCASFSKVDCSSKA